LQERLKSLGKEDGFKATHVHVVGAGTMGGDIAAWCALRGLTVTLQDQTPTGSRPRWAARRSSCRTAARSAPRARCRTG
jgi:3-hydroxyacyl-CoA dehydrogenase/enoyl-CoA hydratase/3-hydroxybutyryl-CoA epimerase